MTKKRKNKAKRKRSIKVLLGSFLLLAPVLAFSYQGQKSLNPEREVTPLHYLFKKTKTKKGKFLVPAPKWNAYSGELSSSGPKIEMDSLQFAGEKAFARSVFRTNNNSRTSFGTSFSVGGNLVLTNFHVYNNQYVVTKCSGFGFKLNPPLTKISFRCKKVHSCYKALDYCLIEVEASRKKYRKKVLSQYVPALPLIKDFTEGNNTVTKIYGNVGGNGIQSSEGRGLRKYMDNKLLHYSPLNGGASGGPMVDANGEVFGLVYAQSKELYGIEAVNFAYPIEKILEDLKEKIPSEIFSLLNIR